VIRDAVETDRPALLALQSLLPEPAPDALGEAIDGPGEVLVATGGVRKTTKSSSAASQNASRSENANVSDLLDAGGDRDCRRPIGYVFAMPSDDRAYVAELVVAPDRRREGVASQLFTRLFDRLGDRGRQTTSDGQSDRERSDDGVRLVTLAVSPDNDDAREFYEEWGFRTVDRDPEYYDGDPALLLARPL